MTQEKSQSNQESSGPDSKGTPAQPASRQSVIASPIFPSDPHHDGGVNQELRRLKRALHALRACNKALSQAGSEQELLDQICDIIVRLGGYRMAGIAYAEPGAERAVRPVAHAGYDSGYLATIELKWSDTPEGHGPVGSAIRENRICVIPDTQSDPRFEPWREAALARGYEAVIALPLRVAGMPFGVLAIYSGQAGSFESSEVDLLAEIADSLAYGITAIRSQEESQRATAALQDAERRYRRLVEQVPAISYVAETGVRGRFIYVSPQAETILGFHPEICVSDPDFWWNHLHPDDRTIAQLEDHCEEGRPFQLEYRMRRQDGRETWIRDEGVIVRDPESGKRLTRGVMVDITERKLADDALRHSEERYRMFLSQSSEGIFRIEYNPPIPCEIPVSDQLVLGRRNGTMAECNDAMAKMYGRSSAKELIGKPLSEFLVLNHPLTRQFMEDFVRSGYRTTDQESREADSHGRQKIFRNTMIGIVDRGYWVRTWGIVRDVTERLHLEEQLMHAQQLEAIGRLAGGVAHDFNNILNIIMGHGELLLSVGEVDERVRNGVEQIQRAAERAATLTQQLLAFSRKQVLLPKVLDLNESVSDIQKMLSRVIGEDIELDAILHPALASAKVDPGQMEQVLMNLAINSRDAMPHGGRLTMETSNIEVGPGQATDLELPSGRYVMLRVADTGHGIDPETLPHIFEPFFSTKPRDKGTGLGLSTVYGIVKQSGGSIWVESEIGQGTEFRVYLPASPEPVPRPQSATSSEKVTGGTETILVVEDEPDLRELTQLFLEGYGYKVLEAASPEKALQLAQSYPGTIDLLLTDVIMPAMSGRQLAENILISRPKAKIVYMTGYTDDMVVQHRVLEPGVKLLQKPFSKADLAQKVRSTLDEK